jgi:PKD repeat protein
MIKKVLFLSIFLICTSWSNAQPITVHKIVLDEMDSIPLQYNEEIIINFDILHKYGCESLITQLINEVTYPFEDSLAFFWNVFNEEKTLSFNYDEENPDIFINEPGNYNVKVVVSGMSGFTDSIIKYNVISVDKMPQIDFSFTPEDALFAEYLGEVEFTNLTNPKFLQDSTVEWYWDMGDNEINRTEWSPVHLFSSWGDYHTTFYLKTKNGCKVALTKTVSIEDDLFFPDTLIKNAIGSSSLFAITNLNTNIPVDDPNEFRTNYLFVYNDLGEKIFEQKNYDSYIKNNMVVSADRPLGADDLSEGKYYFSFFYKGKSKMVHYNGEFFVMSGN